MEKIKEITVFSYGDSTKISTWSNVPYFFTTTLEKKGIVINRVNIMNDHSVFRILFTLFFYIPLKIVDRKTGYNYLRSRLFEYETNRKIKRAVRQFENSDLFVFINFDFTAKQFSDKPSVLFGDWTFEHYIRYFRNKKPNFFEQQYINRQNKHIREADFVFPLFPSMAEKLIQANAGNVKYLGNVINSLYESNEQELIKAKKETQKLLFIGSLKYMEGAIGLLEAYRELKGKYPEMSLDFIGLKASDFSGKLPEGVHCHGYLNKELEEERTTYYNLLKEARIFVNTTPKWSAFSASVEAMYYCTPVIVPPYEEFVKTFGEQFKAGIYHHPEDKLSTQIESVFNSSDYESMCLNAKESVKTFTWDAYIDKMLLEIYG